jgi:CRP-like cAMP-binding protein
MDPILQLLDQSGLTNGMNESMAKQIAALAVKQTYKTGTSILFEDARGRECYLIVEGKVSVNLYIPGSLDRVEPLINLRKSQIFGEFSLIDGAPRSASIRADSDVVVYQFESEKLLQICRENYEFGYHFMKNLAMIIASRLRDTTLIVRNNW